MANPQDTGTFDGWITDRLYFGTLQPPSGDTGTFDQWITDRLYFDTMVAAPSGGKFVNLIDKNSFEFDMPKLNISFSEQFYYGGFLYDSNISINDATRFLEENKNIFDMLANEHI